MEKHYVRFYAPGTIVAEEQVEEVPDRNVQRAKKRAAELRLRHGAQPYAFRFETRKATIEDGIELRSEIVDRSPLYFINCRVLDLDAAIAEEGEGSILVRNMRGNGYDRVATTVEGWKWTMPIGKHDFVLE